MISLPGLILPFRWNRITIIGTTLMLVGIILTPILIGIPIAAVGFSILAINTMVTIVNMFPGGKRVVSEYQKMFGKMFSFLKTIIQI